MRKLLFISMLLVSTVAQAIWPDASSPFYLDGIPSNVTGANGDNTKGHVFFTEFGLSYSSAACDPPLTFVGANKTGFAFHPLPSPTFNPAYPEQLFMCINGRQGWTAYYNSTADQYHFIVAMDAFRPDRGAMPHSSITLGTPSNFWDVGYIKQVQIGTGVGIGEVMGVNVQGDSEGLIWNTTTGGILGVQLLYSGGTSDRFNFNLSGSSRTDASAKFSLGPPTDATNDSNAGRQFVIQGQNRTAGTANGGDVVLQPGTSSGGTQGQVIIPSSFTPANSSATCKVGTIAWDTSFIYVCTSTNTWKRATLATF